MIWPPVKAWTSKESIHNKFHFVAINYGEECKKKWVVLLSVIDSSVVVKVSWSELLDSSKWLPGWGDVNQIISSKSVDEGNVKINDLIYPSLDSGLTIPITIETIRPWF